LCIAKEALHLGGRETKFTCTLQEKGQMEENFQGEIKAETRRCQQSRSLRHKLACMAN
jgi:hypothetical protein